MHGKTINFDTVRQIGLTFPGVEESTAYGFPALKVHGRLLAAIPANRPEVEPGSLGLFIDFNDRAELLAGAPDVYYVTDHYVGHPVVLVRLSRVNADVLRDLLGMAYKFVTGKGSRPKSVQARRKLRPRKR